MTPPRLTPLATRPSLNADILAQKATAWKTMTNAERRVAIAKDVLAMIDEEVLVPARGTFLETYYKDENSKTEVVIRDQSRDNSYMTPFARWLTSNPDAECAVCAVGALLVSVFLRDDPYIEGSARPAGWSTARRYLVEEKEDLFSVEQLRLIELVYEMGGGACQPIGPLERRAQEYGLTLRNENVDDMADPCESSDTRKTNLKVLRTIFKNIIANNGSFIVP
jgi:hypothetical protein